MLWPFVIVLLWPPSFVLGEECPEAVDGQRALLQHKVTLDQSIIDAIQETIKKEVDLALHHGDHGDQGHPVQADGPVATTVNQTALFQGCSAKASRKFARLQPAEASGVEVAAATWVNMTKLSACTAGNLPAMLFSRSSYSETCCPEGSLRCTGCAQYSGSTCQKCSGGFISRSGKCVSCADTSGWVNRGGLTCSQLSTSDCNDVKVKGISSNEACCKCNGGAVTPTPFAYDVKHWALGEQVSMKPHPRTAERYSLDEGCALADYNLTMDGSTGAITQVPGTAAHIEPFSIECTVTAHQTSTATFEAKVRIAMDWFAYGVPLLLFPGSNSFPASKAPGTWKDFAVRCAPNTAWLQVSSIGTLTKSGSIGTGGVMTEDASKAGQTGGVCVVSALHLPTGGKWQLRQAKVMAVWPQPWSSMSYQTSSVSVTLGEQLPILKLPVGSPGTLKPSDFFVACDTTPSLKWSYDSLLSTGLLEGYSVLEVAEDGGISISIARQMAAIFDSMASSGATRKKVTLNCGVWGIFPDNSLTPIKANLNIEIFDDICWVSKSFKAYYSTDNSATSESMCRANCRRDNNCPSYLWTSNQCRRYRTHPTGSSVTAYNKVTNCTADTACKDVQTGSWYQSGLYCPVAPDLFRGDSLYLKKGETPEETLYLSKYVSSIDGPVSGCSNGNWILRQADAEKDYIKLEAGEVELGGRVLRCISGSIPFGVASCGQPNITVPDEGYAPVVVDDPYTSDPADYWLHPCECAPPAWGMEKPVNPESFESVPGKSGNQFTPAPFELVAGQFVCPAKELLDNGVHFETEAEQMERADCEARCKADNLCNFFWHGSQQGANTCRLYSACSHLVREMGLEGRLAALPRSNSCQVADPESCWATSLRRASLTSSHAPNFLYWNLHQQCDEALLLGGMGVETCAHPTYRPITSHKWQHKSLLPQSFPHGTKLGLSCWQERYSGVKGSGSASSIALFCVNGDWFNADNEEELGSFSCEACVQVAGVGFKQIEARNEQEIWYMNRMRLSLATEVVDNTQTGMHCLKFGSGSTELKMVQQTKCGSTIMAEFHGVTDSSSRLVKLVEGSNQCLQEAMLGDLPIGIHSTCSSGATAQQIPMEDLPGMLWRIHTKDHEQAGHRLSPSLIDCWGRGAIGKVEMMHLFNTNRAQTAAYVGRVRVPGLIVGQGNNQWHRLSANIGFGWSKSDYPDATETRMCLTYSDHATSSDGNLKVRLRRVDGAGGTVYFTDSFGITWSGTGLFHHVCGPWHAISTISCGYSWTDTCQVDWLHSTWMSIKTVELEFGSSNPNHARFFRGRMDLPVTYDGTPTANTWTSIGNWFYLATNQYDGNFVRICVVFTDSSTSGTFSVRLRKADGTIFFTDNLGNTWSASGLMHAECGSWHSSSGISCGRSWGNTCQLQMLHTQNVHTKVYEADLEFKSDSTSTPTAYLGRMKLDAYASTTATSNWFRISPDGLFINTDDYPTATEIRPCIVFSDSSSGQGTVKVRLRRTDLAGGTIFYEDDFGDTYSGSGLYHVTCGAWRSVTSISCGTSWVNTCQLDAMHGQAVSTTISSYFMEFRVALARDVCRFAPVITRMAGNTAELFKIGSWSDWQYRLSDAPIYCPEGKILTDLDASTEHMRYSCGSVAGLGSCSEGFTAQADVKDWSTYANLGTLSIVCPQDALLNGFHFEFSEGGRWIRFRYTCCHAAGAPMALIPVQPGPASSMEGLYCPVGKDASGRPMYDQTFESPTVLTSSMVSLTAWACECCQCANGKTTIDVGRYGTVAAGNSFGVTGWCGKCVLYCDGVKADEYALWGSSDSGRAFPSQCTGAISVEIHGGGHCGGCEVKGSGLMINPWPKQPSLLDTSSESHTAPQRLSFDPNAGKWCLAGTCTQVDGRVQPIGLSSQSFDIVAVSDFDGVFQGKGVPKQGGGNAAALKARLRAIKTPKRPKAPKVPKLETFTPEEPTFAAECMDYNRLWASIQESYKDADGTVTPHTNQLKAEPVYDLSETNPCEVAAAVSGTRGKIGGGDGRSTPEKMPYTELDGCAARVITRDLELAKRERDSEIFQTIFDIADESMDLVCDAPPNIETAPMGVGAEFQAEDWCTDGFNLAHAMVLMASFHGGIGFANSIYEVEKEDNQDCDPLQAGLDRLFCDIHCVRDAVVRGDRAILRNLKAATEVTNNNMKKMVEWSVAANRAETGWLAAKLDTTEDRLSIRIQMVQDALATSNTAALQEAKEVSGSMLEELAGFADAASLNAVSRHTANEALEEYLRSAELSGGPNISRAGAALQQLEMLHAKMSSAGSASRMHTLGQQFQREAANLQVLAKKQLQILGVYKERGNLTSHAVRTWQEETHAIERRNALVQVDRIWWELRSTLDNYLEVAELQVKAFMDSLTAIESYEHCSANLGQVQKSYAQTLKARDSGHFVLRETWRDSVNLIGELASVIVDGEIFQIFVDTEGCHSTLVTQTMKQVRFAVRSLSLLSHRFEVGGLPKPDGTSLLQSLRRIRKSFKAAKAGCDNGKDVAGK